MKTGVVHAKRPVRPPVVMSRDEVKAVLGHLSGVWHSWRHCSMALACSSGSVLATSSGSDGPRVEFLPAGRVAGGAAPCFARGVRREEDLYKIRTASPLDCETLATLRRQLQQSLEQESSTLWRMTEARKVALPDFYAESIADAGVQVLLAEAREQGSDRIVGPATGRIETGRDVPRFGSIEDVWVEPEYRGRGICRAFVSRLADFFRAHRVEKLTVGFVHGEAAAAVWQHLGFAPTVVVANSDIDTIMSRSR